MNFFEHQDEARRNTTRLVILFAVAVISMIMAIYIVAVMALASSGSIITTWQPEILDLIIIGVLGTVGVGSLSKTWKLRGGGKVVALDMGGRLLEPLTQDATEQRVLNVVEEMAIASGTPVPPVYLMDRESGINAFAAGFTINDAVIGVTRGCVERLSRDELQGVIAHEFSHIINGDMRLNLLLIGVLQGILMIHLLGRATMRGMWHPSGYRDRKDMKEAGFTFVMAIALTAIGFIGFLCGRMIKSAVSRQREFLADASAVQFTRNPLGISGALRKIGGFTKGSTIMTPKAEEASHLFFGEAISANFNSAFATHPPLGERIRRLENLPNAASVQSNVSQGKSVKGTIGQGKAITPHSSSANASVLTPESPMGFAPTSPPTPTLHPTSIARAPARVTPSHSPQPSPSKQTVHINPDTVVSQIGTTDPAHLDYARSLLAQLPQPIKTALKHRQGSQALIYALLLDVKHKKVRDRQVIHLKQTEPTDTLKLTAQLAQRVYKLDPRSRLPLVDLTVPALRDASKSEFSRFFKQIQALVQADGRISLSEYTLQVVLMRRLEPYFTHTPNTQITHASVDPIWQDCLTILSGLANVGHDTLDAATDAFRAGVQRLPGASKRVIPSQPVASDIPKIGKSLKTLTKAAPKVKQAMVDACAYTVLIDGDVTVKESELLRAIVISLDCPIPPFLDRTTSR